MMRVPGAYAIAVRNPRNEIISQRTPFVSITESHPRLKWPVIRGVVALFESMKIGFATLNQSADIAFDEVTTTEKTMKEQIQSWLATALALVLGVGLFFVLPLFITTKLFNLEKTALLFNLSSGGMRIAFFLIYLWAISLMKDVKRLFQYHGAEHKAVYTFEAGKQLTLEEARPFPTQHPRCGTSFLFIVLLSAILLFAIIDTILIWMVAGDMSLKLRLLVHLPLIPLVAGISYEVLKFTARHRNWAWVRALAAPGLWLQNITTSEPDDEQLTVALESLKTAFGEDLVNYQGKNFTAEAIG
ncbi:MAG: DUF1385 domain-containing protein [Candidatus Marinimicrobia bacterium CG_4_10_14_0_2_um_filter_48_9]|nr:MAG: DUF1385 domain-containing protein [Candidatus Marinimicrobia bacterium CG_4_10_14_0_2_um_filter_48_9]PJA54128.1 MAG: DUF1385 domain-containing protein [Candidatus Marinimicrobia bacterium CG_4_9_14_3_um_filter_48_9]